MYAPIFQRDFASSVRSAGTLLRAAVAFVLLTAGFVFIGFGWLL